MSKTNMHAGFTLIHVIDLFLFITCRLKMNLQQEISSIKIIIEVKVHSLLMADIKKTSVTLRKKK